MQPNDDERMLAAIAHASIIANIFNLAGMFAAMLIWATQRERSVYVRVHSLQALLYQGLALLAGLALAGCWGLCLLVSLLPAAVRPDLYRSSPPNSFWIALLGLVVPIGFGVATTLYGLYGAYQAYRGRPFRYPIAGRVARELLAPQPQAAAPAPDPGPDAAAPSEPASPPSDQAPTEPPPIETP